MDVSNRTGKKRLLIAAAAGGVMVVAACGLAIPSGDLPKVEQRWIVTALETTISMGDLINQTLTLSRARATMFGASVQGDSNGGTGCLHVF